MGTTSLAPLVRRLRFKHLELLHALDRSRNLHVAAQQMNVTQPAVTKILHDAEDLFGFPIFERRPKGLQPTKLGELVIHFAQVTLGTTARLVDEIAEVSERGSGTLKVGAILGAGDLVAEAIGELKNHHPSLLVHLLARTSDQLLPELEEHRLDVVVGRLATSHQLAQFDFRSLMREPLWAVVNAAHPLSGKRRIRLAQLIEWPWILQPGDSPMRQLLDEAFDLAGVIPPINVVETISIFGTLQLLQASPAVAVLPASVARNYVDHHVLVRLPVTFHRELGQWGTLTRKNDVMPPATEQFVALLSQAVVRRSKSEAQSGVAPVEPIRRAGRKRAR